MNNENNKSQNYKNSIVISYFCHKICEKITERSYTKTAITIRVQIIQTNLETDLIRHSLYNPRHTFGWYFYAQPVKRLCVGEKKHKPVPRNKNIVVFVFITFTYYALRVLTHLCKCNVFPAHIETTTNIMVIMKQEFK